MSLRIGIDVGGTNTDAVLLDGRDILASVKRPTTPDVTAGIVAALISIFDWWRDGQARDVSAVMIGTTHFTNAVVERRNLTPVALLRLCLPAGQAIPPLFDWPDDLRDVACKGSFLLHGGLEFDGRPISELDDEEIRFTLDELENLGVKSSAIVGTFSPVSPHQEIAVADQLRSRFPNMSISLSHEIGKLGALERENATALNATLAGLAKRTIEGFQAALEQSGLDAQLYLSQNDGTLMTAEHAARYPVLTFASGPTNSMRGAAMLSGISDGIVLDVGGTTTDGGALSNGFPREASFEVEVGGVRTNFRMPDVVNIGLGGGSLISDDGAKVGPHSVGYHLTEAALTFGGSTATFTDVATALGIFSLDGPTTGVPMSPQTARRAMDVAMSSLASLVDSLKLSGEDAPVILVGGGAALFPTDMPGASEVVRPDHSEVANAIGAAIAQVSGEIDRVFSMEGRSRENVLDAARAEAIEHAVQAGAVESTVEIVEIDEIPLAYLPSNALRVRMKAVGDLDDR